MSEFEIPIEIKKVNLMDSRGKTTSQTVSADSSRLRDDTDLGATK